MVGEVYAGIQGFNALLGGLKAVVDIRDETKRGAAIIDLTRQVIQLQREAVESSQVQAALAEKVRALEAELVKLKARGEDRERYEPKPIGGGSVGYMLKPEARGTEPPHWLCPSCHANGKKSVYQLVVRAGIGWVYRCGGCGGTVTAQSQPTWS